MTPLYKQRCAALAGAVLSTLLLMAALAAPAREAAAPRADFIRAKDGTAIYVKDWGQGPPIVFNHGWPLNADIWDEQMMFMASRGFRCVAFDRRGFGRSGQPRNGNDYDTAAEDLSNLMGSLGLRGATLVGYSAGAGDIARYICRNGTGRVADGIVAFSQTDFTADLQRIEIPVLVMHSENDQIVPYADAGPLSAKLLKKGALTTYKGLPHGMPTTHAVIINADLLAFIES